MNKKFILTPQGNRSLYGWLKDELFRLNLEIRNTKDLDLNSLSVNSVLNLPVYDLSGNLKVMPVVLQLNKDNSITLKAKS